MKWTLEQLDSLETEILKLHLHTKLSDSTLADCMSKIDTERFKINQANGVTTGDELVLPIQSVVPSTLYDCDNCMNYPCALQEWSSDKGHKLKLNECGDKVELKPL